ncbi:MAG: hypothetical protein R3C05_28920 [Pirellulaceae bacterium]
MLLPLRVSWGQSATAQQTLPPMQIVCQHPNRICKPGETVTFQATPERIPQTPNRVFHCEAFLTKDGREIVLSRTTRVGMTDRFGKFKPLRPFKMELPGIEGEYQIVVETKTNSDGGGTANELIDVSRLDILVLAESSPAGIERKSVAASGEFSDEQNDWSFLRQMNLSEIATVDRPSDLFSGDLIVPMDGEPKPDLPDDAVRHTVRQLELDGLPIDQPILLEVLMPEEIAMRYRFQLRDSTSDSVIFDSVIDVQGIVDEASASVVVHRLPFWSHSGNAQLRIEQTSGQVEDSRSAIIRLHVGRNRLPSFVADDNMSTRRVVPLVNLNSVFRRVGDDTSSARVAPPEKSWTVLQQTGERFAQLLQYHAQDTVFVQAIDVDVFGNSVDHLGVLNNIERADDSVPSARSSTKDVLELWLRLFDREGMSLIPAIYFDNLTSSTQADEFASDANPNVGFDLIEDLVRQVAEKYEHHESFAGVAIVMTDRNKRTSAKTGAVSDDLTAAMKERLDALTTQLFAEHPSRRLYALDTRKHPNGPLVLGETQTRKYGGVAWLQGSETSDVALPYELLTTSTNAIQAQWLNDPTLTSCSINQWLVCPR